MAKKINSNEKPFSFLDKSVINSVQSGAPIQAEPAKVAAPTVEVNPVKQDTSEVIQFASKPAQESAKLTTSTTNYSIQPPVQSQPKQNLAIENATPRALNQLVEKFDQEKRILLTKRESQSFDRLSANLARTLNTSVKVSHIFRAAISLITNSETQLIHRAEELGSLTRPSNGDAQAMQKFEKDLANLIAKAIMDSGGVR